MAGAGSYTPNTQGGDTGSLLSGLMNLILGRNNNGEPTTPPQLPQAGAIVPSTTNASTIADATNLANGGKAAPDGTVSAPKAKTQNTMPQIDSDTLTRGILNMNQLLPVLQQMPQQNGSAMEGFSKVMQLFGGKSSGGGGIAGLLKNNGVGASAGAGADAAASGAASGAAAGGTAAAGGSAGSALSSILALFAG